MVALRGSQHGDGATLAQVQRHAYRRHAGRGTHEQRHREPQRGPRAEHALRAALHAAPAVRVHVCGGAVLRVAAGAGVGVCEHGARGPVSLPPRSTEDGATRRRCGNAISDEDGCGCGGCERTDLLRSSKKGAGGSHLSAREGGKAGDGGNGELADAGTGTEHALHRRSG